MLLKLISASKQSSWHDLRQDEDGEESGATDRSSNDASPVPEGHQPDHQGSTGDQEFGS